MTENKISIHVPRDLYKEIKRKVKSSQGEFKNVEEYVEFVLRKDLGQEEPEQLYTPREEDEIKKRLRSLGYF